MRLIGLCVGGGQQVTTDSAEAASTAQVRQQRRGRTFLSGVRSLFGRGRTAIVPRVDQTATPEEPQVQLREGRLELGATGATDQLFEARLNQPHKRYQDLQQDDQGNRLVDEAGRPFHIQRTQGAQAVLKASTTDTADLPSPGPAHIGLISGVYTNAEGEQERLMNGLRYRLDATTQRWLPQGDIQRYQRLVRLGNGQLEGIPQYSRLRDVSVSPDGARVELHLDSQRRRVTLSDTTGAGRTAVLGTSHGQGHRNLLADHIGLGPDNRLYAADSRGDLYVQADGQETGEVLLMRQVEQPVLDQALDGAVRFERFLHDDDGRLTAVVRDRHDQLHACPLGGDHQFQPGWNLTDALVSTVEAGLPLAFEPALNKTVELGARGRLALKDGHLQAWDCASQRWTPTEHGNITRLDHGLDGRAYLLQRGEIKSLDATREAVVLPLGVPHELALTDKRTRVEVGGALAAPRQLRNFAVADDQHFAVVGENGSLTAHVDGRKVTLPHPPGEGSIVDLALDHRQALHALVETSSGIGLYSLERHQWQGLAVAQEQWREVSLPPAAHQGQATLRTGASKQPELTVLHEHDEQRHSSTYRLDGGVWQRVAVPVEEPDQTISGDAALHERLSTRYHGHQVLGGNLNTTSSLLGQTTEGALQTKRDMLGSVASHWHPLEGLSNGAKTIQHHYRGRDGLQELYTEEQRLMKRLPELAARAEPAHGLDQRVERASRRRSYRPLAEAITKWAGELEDHSEGLARKLGQTHRLLDDQGLPRTRYRPPLQSRGNIAGRIANRLAGGGRHQVLDQLADAFSRVRGRSEGKTEQQLRELSTLGLKLDYVPSGRRRRDTSDKGALLRDGLVLNAETLEALHKLVDELDQLRLDTSSTDESESGTAPDSALFQLARRFDELRHQYEQNPVQQYGQTQATGHRQLESLYDSHRRLNNDLAGDRRALGRLTRQVLDAKRTPIAQALAAQLRQLEPGASLDVAETNSIDVVAPVYFAFPFAYFQGGVGQDHSRALSLARTDEGMQVRLAGNTTRRANAGVGFGLTLPIANGTMVGAFTGGEVNLSGARIKGTSVGFRVDDGDTERLARHLTTRDAKLRELLELGQDFKTTAKTESSVDLDLWGGVDVRVSMAQAKPSEDNPSGADIWFRASLSVGASVNALHAARVREQVLGPNVERGSVRSDTLQGLSMATADMVRLRPPQALGGAYALTVRTGTEINSKIYLDRSRTRSFNVKFTPAKPVAASEIESLLGALQQEFPIARGQLRTIRNQRSAPNESLAALAEWRRRLPRNERRTDHQHAVLNSLDNLVRRQHAAEQGRRQFASAETRINIASARGWLAPPKQPKGLFNGLREAAQQPWLKEIAPANAAAIRDVLRQDPRFARLMAALEAKGTSARMVLELKDEPRQRLEEMGARGESVERALRSALTKSENLRIKSLTVDHGVTRSSAFTAPPLLLSVSSSATVSHSRKQGTIEFQYGVDQDRPLTMTLDGELAQYGVGTDLRQRLAQEGTRLHYIGEGRLPSLPEDEPIELSPVGKVTTASMLGVPGGGSA